MKKVYKLGTRTGLSNLSVFFGKVGGSVLYTMMILFYRNKK